MTPFEQQLAETPLRDLPPEWRARLVPPRRNFAWRAFIRHLFWPHPLAWGALAACWAVIAGLNFSGPRGPELYAVSPSGSHPAFYPSADLWCMWQLERRYLILMERPEAHPYLDSTKL